MTITAAGPEVIARLEPLWRALHEHHVSCAPRASTVRPFRDGHGSWERRSRRYEKWLRGDGAVVFVAVRGEELVGYALVTVSEGGESTLATGERVGILESLALVPGERGGGIGTALMDAVYSHLRSLGARELILSVMDGNDAARRFYERLGLQPYTLTMIGPVPDLDQ